MTKIKINQGKIHVDNGWKCHNGIIHSKTYITWDSVPPAKLLERAYLEVAKHTTIPTEVDYQPSNMKKEITEAEARAMTTCPACAADKQQGLVVCWHCFKHQPRTSAVVMPGYKYWQGSLSEFVTTSNIPF